MLAGKFKPKCSHFICSKCVDNTASFLNFSRDHLMCPCFCSSKNKVFNKMCDALDVCIFKTGAEAIRDTNCNNGKFPLLHDDGETILQVLAQKTHMIKCERGLINAPH